MPLPRYWCEATAHPSAEEVRVHLLGSRTTNTSRLALRWLRDRAQDITDQMDEPYAEQGRQWLTDEAEHERALRTLTQGQLYELTLHDDATRYVLSARRTGCTR
ncbi:hypothetical protein [Streptomyces sp. NPDC020965]|uniref:hypothetical protein n=1 Tax=Streptomyces sp. NPDC020965 TaxID=3365105 RepID=UPI0037BA985D